MKSIVLLSGGLDSVTLLHYVSNLGHQIHSLTFNYEQRNVDEILAARKIATELPVRSHLLVKIDAHTLGGSPLSVKGLPMPLNRSTEEIGSGKISPMYVPARNTIFLAYALAHAESVKADEIYFGANASDHAGFPDCRWDYFVAWQRMAELATARKGPKLHLPFIRMTKAEIVKLGLEMNVDYSGTVSCYQQDKAGPCGACDACVLRAEAFAANEAADPALSVAEVVTQ